MKNKNLQHLQLRVEHYEGIRLLALQRNHAVMAEYAEKSILELRLRISNLLKKNTRKSIFSR